MKLLKEAYGESTELDTFVSQVERRFSEYYLVELKLGRENSRRYFSLKDGAYDYYNSLLKLAKEDPDYYDGASISLSEVSVQPMYDELESTIVGTEETEQTKEDIE